MNSAPWIISAGVLGALGVAMGAFGAHALPGMMEKWQLPPAEVASRMTTLEIGVRYHVYHALALLAVGSLAAARPHMALDIAGGAFVIGILLFSGLLYGIALTGVKMLGAIVPLGGVAFLVGWSAVAVAGFSLARPS